MRGQRLIQTHVGLALFALTFFILGVITDLGINRFSGSSQIIQNKFDAVHRSAIAIASAVDVGVDLKQFLTLLQTLQAEASLLAEKVTTSSERELLAKYNDVIEIYKNSYLVWRTDIEAHGYSTGIADLPEHRVPLKDYYGQTIPSGLMAQIAKQYDLPVTPVEVQGHMIDTITVASVWQVARKKIDGLGR